jgi:hypothetical protein
MEAEHSLEQVLQWESRQVPWERVAVLLMLTVGAPLSCSLASVCVLVTANVGHPAYFIRL